MPNAVKIGFFGQKIGKYDQILPKIPSLSVNARPLPDNNGAAGFAIRLEKLGIKALYRYHVDIEFKTPALDAVFQS